MSGWIATTGLNILNTKIESKLAIFDPGNIEIWRMISKNNGAPLLCPPSIVHFFTATCQLKLDLSSGNAKIEAKVPFCDLEKQKRTSSKLPQASHTIS